MPKLLLLADGSSTHISKWALSLASKGFEIGIFSLRKDKFGWYKNVKNISYLYEGSKNNPSTIDIIKAAPRLKKIISDFKPDIIHAHYASSYGLLGALTGFHPFIVSVWGSDIFDFPNRSLLNKLILKYNLRKADMIMSTSHNMAIETAKYTAKKIQVTPFGIELDVFKPRNVERPFDKDDIVIGTIKVLDRIYGVQYLVESFSILVERYPQMPLKLFIVGSGPMENELREMCTVSGLQTRVRFTGWVDYVNIPLYHNMLDIFVALSESESFGVAVLEASASGNPVVVSNVGGLAEVVENGSTGLIVPAKNAKAAANAIEKLITDKELAQKLGSNGRNRVEKLFDWRVNLEHIIHLYYSLLKK